jgi:hypothetical protein
MESQQQHRPATLPPGDYDITVKADDDNDTHPNEWLTIRITIQPGNPIFVTPALDPVLLPRDAGSDPNNIPDGANEFTYSNGLVSGFLDIKLKVYMRGIGNASAAEKARYTFDVSSVGSSIRVWGAGNGGGTPTINGDYLEASVTFVGLPQNNSDFGSKYAYLARDGTAMIATPYEVFFPRDGKNHPGTGQFTTPNWFYYWQQLAPAANVVYGGEHPEFVRAEVKAGTKWSYAVPQNKTEITMYDHVVTIPGQSHGVGKSMSGVDRFIGTLIHELKHVDQIARADLLLPTNGSDAFRYGWAWIFGAAPKHNHWSKGPDGQWGRAGVDDDSNGIIDDAAVSPPFEPGNVLSDDIDLTHSFYPGWPAAWPVPSPNIGPHPIEGEAINACDAVHDEHKSARSDWGNPGKNHATLNRFDN